MICVPRAQGFPHFFTRQLFLFLALALLIIVVDFVMYVFIAYHESERNFNDGTPIVTTRAVDAALTMDNGTYTLATEGVGALATQNSWAMLIDDEGAVVWEYEVPDGVARSYAPNDVAMAAHYGNIADYPTFFWKRNDGLLVVGFPKGTFWHLSLSYPTDTIRNLPLYLLMILTLDLVIFFLYILISRRRTQRSVAPITGALDALSTGGAVKLHLKGDLREVGEQLNETSAIIERKDAARANWIRGVSHDIRTPLSMILGYADTIVDNSEADECTRQEAAVIRSQALKIKDLVVDLNTASQLAYDMQPLRWERVHLARLLRSVITDHANAGFDESYPIDLFIDHAARDAVVFGDERMLTRAVENVLANARLHNAEGCSIHVRMTVPGDGYLKDGNVHIVIEDDGMGVSRTDLALLQSRLARARSHDGDPDPEVEHGLGLVLVDRIVRAHRGSLDIDSRDRSDDYGWSDRSGNAGRPDSHGQTCSPGQTDGPDQARSPGRAGFTVCITLPTT